jgi:glycosyltransferase involved in cell wall biosynthesis
MKKDFVVVHVTNYYFPTLGGLSTYIKTLKDKLEVENIKNYVIAFPFKWREGYEKIPIKFLQKIIHLLFVFMFIVNSFFYILFLKLKHKKIIIHSHDTYFCALIGQISKSKSCKHIHTFHTAHKLESNFINNLIYSRIKEKYFVSEFIYNKYISQFGKTEKQIILFPIDIPKEKVIFDSHKVKKVLFVGNFLDYKDPMTLIKAIETIKNKISLQVIMVGEGELKSKMEKYISNHNLKEIFRIIEPLEKKELEKYYLQSDVFVLPSKEEAYGIVVLEALSYGLPVVTTRSGGPSKFINENKNGYLVKKENPVQLGNAIIKAIINQKRLGKNARILAKEQFSWKKGFSKFYNLYFELFKEPAKKTKNKISFVIEEPFTFNTPAPSRISNIIKNIEEYVDIKVYCKFHDFSKENSNLIQIKKPDILLGDLLFRLKLNIRILMDLIDGQMDTIITRKPYQVLLFAPICYIFRRKLIYDMHSFRYKELLVEKKYFKAFLNFPLEHLSWIMSSFIIVISKQLIDDLPKFLKKKIIFLQNGVDLEEFSSLKIDKSMYEKYQIPKSKKIIGFIGNYIDWLDIETIQGVSKNLKDNLVILVVGDFHKYKNLISSDLKLESIIFTGKVPHKDALKLLKIMDVCLLPYKKNPILRHLSIRKVSEYLAAGKPILISDSLKIYRNDLIEGENVVSYKTGNVRDLENKLYQIIDDDILLKNLCQNNRRLSKNYSWDIIIGNSRLDSILEIYRKNYKIQKTDFVSIIIKVLNEEEHIEMAIKSALEALNKVKGEVIIVDSKSTDRTIEIAKKFPVKIYQLSDENDKCCGIGPQIGYHFAQGNFIYILDGDMNLNKDFIVNSLTYFSSPEIAGVGGNILEKSKNNLVFQVREKGHLVNKITKVNQLGMGGLYRKSIIDEIGCFSNPYLYAYEEYDLGAKIGKMNYKLIRIPIDMITHFGDVSSAFKTIFGRFKSKYIFGSGQYLRISIVNGHFLKTFWELKIYIVTLLMYIIGFILVYLKVIQGINFINLYIWVVVILLVLVALIKRNMKRFVFSIISWTVQSMGVMIGFFMITKNPRKFVPNVIQIK